MREHHANLTPVTTDNIPTLDDSTILGITSYELSNHLGNVLSVITDKKIGVPLNDSVVNYFVSEVLSQQDYYPFGMEQYYRQYQIEDNNYPYSFNGKRDDIDVSVGYQNYGMREYDKLTGRFISVDPLFKRYPELSSYQFANNRPIQAIDIDGLENLNAQWGYGQMFKLAGVTNSKQIEEDVKKDLRKQEG